MGKILVVEDDRDMRKQICKFLVREKHGIIEAENGKIGLEKATELKPDLILSDIMMPEMDGFALLEEIRKEPATRLIPFIILTVKGRDEDVLKGLRLGGSGLCNETF